MSGAPERPPRYRGIPVRAEGDQEHPSVAGTVLLSVIALGATLVALIVIFDPDPNNVPGDVMRSVILAALAGWIDWSAIQRWQKIAISTG